MNYNWKEYNKEKGLFKSYYCLGCKQRKPCHILSGEYCCSCYYQTEQERAKEYSNYEKVLITKKREKKEKFQQLQLLKNYQGCKCRSKEVDACELYDNNRLICQPCRMKKENSASGAISFLGQKKWYKRYWKIDLTEWLENFSQLPTNKKCADQWTKDKEHLKNCVCLEQETKELYLLFANSLQKSKEKLKKCSCVKSEKVRVDSDYYAWCEVCQKAISVASKKRVIKNRNDPRFWGLEIKEKVLCLECLGKFQEKIPANKKYTFRKYLKRGY